ncbi:MAG: amidohydrolase family protein [Pyrinomonadaceae bacterium]
MKILSADHLLPISSEPVENGAVAVEAGKIVAVGGRKELARKFPETKIEDFGPAVLMPGLINVHAHLELTAMRGLFDELDGDFFSWLIALTKTRGEILTEDDIFSSAAFGALEGARAGVTCFGDIGRLGKAGFEALKGNGLRGIAFQETDFSPSVETAEADFTALKEKFSALREAETSLVRAGISPHSPYTVSRLLFEKITDFALAQNVPLTIHAAESSDEELFLKTGEGFFSGFFRRSGIKWDPPGTSAIEYLKEIGVLRAKPLLAHCVKVSSGDIETIAESDSSVAHCPKSNAKFGHGAAPLEEFLRRGIRVGLGSDSMASNNVCDLFEEARFAALMARTREDRLNFPGGKQLIEMITLGGARALGLEKEIGTLETGKQADIIAVSLENAAQMPVHDVYTALLFASNARDVRMTMVAGEEIFSRGESKKADEARLKAKMREIAEKIRAAEKSPEK